MSCQGVPLVMRALVYESRPAYVQRYVHSLFCMIKGRMIETLRERYPPPWRIDELSGDYRVVSSKGFTLAWIYSADGIARSADPHKLTRREALAMARAIAALASETFA